jgi:RNA polymerase sigma-70 factor (ECF subfamily)
MNQSFVQQLSVGTKCYLPVTVPIPEADITQLLIARDTRAIGLIYDKYGDTLYGVVSRMLNNDAAARDVMQEAFVKVWNHADTFDASRSTLFTWMLRVFRNTALDLIRADKTRRDHTERMASETEEHAFTGFKPEHLDFPDRIADLEPKYRVVIEALFFGGMTQQEASDQLEIPLGTVKTRLKIALRELRNVFGEQQLLLLLVMTLCS